ncbi:fibronectin-binding SSURE repeat-containing protein [Streptococcus cristatus]|uniref:SSURE domain-containing protein n=1 Tax=Streptococcus cristatus TaxID=45634 RepID=UPI001CBDF691|nr:fibronectin-binding SSURE repeat-containing protein [Streptococcus cristatus]MBZ2151765.1 fibronectin-binding SSURE repeat-containing protein [Streptococcus cristatus]
MKFNPNQKYTRWSIRRLSVGVASVVVASGFFLLVGQPNTVHADVLTSTPAQVLQVDSSSVEKNELPETVLKEAVDSALTANQTTPTPKEVVDETNSTDKSSSDPNEEAVKPKEEEVMPEVSKPKEEVKPVATPDVVSKQDPEATTPQSVTTQDEVKKGVEENTKDSVDVPASYLEKANVPGPFLAGVNQVIPYEAFGGDGMLTRLLLKSSDKAPWSDNGIANNPALLPLEGLAKGQYFYEVDLNGNTTGKDGQALLDQLRTNGTNAYQATVKVYGAKDGKADLTNLVATKNVTVNLNGLISKEAVKDSVTKNIKDHIDVPASYLEKANVPGPFLAGVNQVIPYEAFGGDGMLTRLLLKSSDKAPWSDNGTSNNPALLPLEGLAKGQYFYEVDLNGNTTGKDGQALLDQLRANGTNAYQATVKVYGAKDGKPDLTNLVATKNVTVNLNGLISKEAVKDSVTKNIKDHIDVPASYLEKANVPGPFLAGVNQVIPYEAFGGDGMLTRLLLKASDKAPWSDNGSAKNPALLPLEGLAKGQYFYEVDLNGNTTGKDGQALLDQLRANGTYAYQATVKVYGTKDGKPDLTNLIATRQVTIQLHGKEMATTPSQEGQMNKKPSATDSMSTAKGTKEVDHSMTDVKVERPTSKPMVDTMKKNDKPTLPNTGEAQTATATIGFLGLALAGILSLLGLKEKQED